VLVAYDYDLLTPVPSGRPRIDPPPR
jgi:hypothetical protein